VAREIAGAQAQDARAGRLTFRARNPRLTAADVDRARAEERSLLLTWAMRNTLHLLSTEDALWMLPLFQPRLEAFTRRRLGHYGVATRAQDRGVATMRQALEADGPLTRGELVERLGPLGIEITPERRMLFVGLAVATGVACLGPDAGRTPKLASAREWLGADLVRDRDGSLRELARRYFGAFGPATDADFAAWAGLPLGELRSGMRAIASELRETRVGRAAAWSLKRAPRRAPRGTVRLLPSWDTYLLGYRDREFIAGARWKRIAVGGGMYTAAIVRDGVAIGTWAIRGPRDRPGITTEPFERLDAATTTAIDAEVADVLRFEAIE
jgi:Winged helix DNA-binding domain